jgi:hypothetical protein
VEPSAPELKPDFDHYCCVEAPIEGGQHYRITLVIDPIITLIGGPTVLVRAGGFRLLTDPTFDPPGEYRLPYVTLKNLPARR